MKGYHGFVALNRREMLEHPLYHRERFTKMQAFFDLILLANHSESEYEKRGIAVTVYRGQVARSKVELADRWKWDPKTVTKFLKYLVEIGDVESKSFPGKNPVTTIITIKRYSSYVSVIKNMETKMDSNTQTKKLTKMDTYNNKNNEKNAKKKELNTEDTASQLITASQLFPASQLMPVQEFFKSGDFDDLRLTEDEQALLEELMEWAYGWSFYIKKKEDDLEDQFAVTIKTYGASVIRELWEQRPEDPGWRDENGKGYSNVMDFWDRVRLLKEGHSVEEIGAIMLL